MQTLRHHHLAIAHDRYAVEVWADSPVGGLAPTVVLYTSSDDDTHYVELTPSEARALAALLIVAAETQEKAGAA